MGFKEYEKLHHTDEKTSNNMSYEKPKKESQKVENLYNQYKNKSEDELIEELYKHVAKQKQNGTFDYNTLSNMLEKISPLLSTQQKQKMKEILENLK